jgi:hypothetical protein
VHAGDQSEGNRADVGANLGHRSRWRGRVGRRSLGIGRHAAGFTLMDQMAPNGRDTPPTANFRDRGE